MKKTKILCTIGPSSWQPDVMKKMYDNGMNVARLNGAFIDIPEMERVAKVVRETSDDIGIMLDIKGHELRLNKFEDKFMLNIGDEFVIGSKEEDKVYPITYPNLYKEVTTGQKIMIDKGKVILEVTKVLDGKIFTKALQAGKISGGKGMNTPGVYLNNSPVTSRDIEQINYALKDGWDFVAASFIRSKEDLIEVKKHLKGSSIKLISKIEDVFGVQNIDEIIDNCDGIMIGRGDLAAEVPFQKVPLYQKTIIQKCRDRGKVVITATEMLESMIENPYPTRAEISDVANAVLDGTDCLMLSGETTMGKFPAECVLTMTKIAEEMEANITPLINDEDSLGGIERDAISKAAFEICDSLAITKVVIVSNSGFTAQSLARHSIKQPIICLINDDSTRRQLLMSSNIYSYLYDKDYSDRDSAVDNALMFCKSKQVVNDSDKILFLGRSSTEKHKYNYIFEIIDCSSLK